MRNDNSINSIKDVIKKLERKAELCRYCHSELRGKYQIIRKLKEFTIIALSVSLSVLTGLYYRNILSGELVLALIFIWPSLIIMVQVLDTTVFHWASKMARHETAVRIWGNWIRDADFLKKNICQYENDVANEKVKNIQGKYNECMNNTPQIPNKNFLKYKMDFREHLLKSQKIDTMTLGDIENEKKQ